MQPSNEELRFLLKWAFADVEAARSKAAPFNLLKAVITRRLVVPEVYDLIDRVQELMIKSHVRHSLHPVVLGRWCICSRACCCTGALSMACLSAGLYYASHLATRFGIHAVHIALCGGL